MQKLLFTGASGFLGYCLDQFPSSFQLHGTYLNHAGNLKQIQLHQLDIRSTKAFSTLIDRIKPNAVIHAAALSKPAFCEMNIDASLEVNVDATARIAKCCKQHAIPFVFTSTDQVFSGKKEIYHETDIPDPIHVYGTHKYEAEKQVQAIMPNAIIARLPLLFGLSPASIPNFLGEWIKKLSNKEQVFAFTDERRTPLYGLEAIRALFLLLNKEGKGIYHLGTERPISRYEKGLMICDAFKLDASYLIPTKLADYKGKVPRVPNASLDISRLKSLGFIPTSLSASLNECAKQPIQLI